MPRSLAIADWLPDIAANLVAVLVIILALTTVKPASTVTAPTVLSSHTRAPLSGAEMVSALYARVREDGNARLIDLTTSGSEVIIDGPEMFVFVLSGSAHAGFSATQTADWKEVIVPEALKSGDTWSADFLALERAQTIEDFIAGLRQILLEHGQAMPTEIERPATWYRLTMWARTMLNAMLMLSALWLLRLVYRRSSRSA